MQCDIDIFNFFLGKLDMMGDINIKTKSKIDVIQSKVSIKQLLKPNANQDDPSKLHQNSKHNSIKKHGICSRFITKTAKLMTNENSNIIICKLHILQSSILFGHRLLTALLQFVALFSFEFLQST